MRKYSLYLADIQQDTPVCCCGLCGSDLYDLDEFYVINSLIVCEDCLPDFAREEYRSFRLTGREWRQL